MEKLTIPSLPFDKIAALNRVHRILICAGTFLLLVGLFIYLIYIPKAARINELKEELDGLQVKLVKARASAKELEKYEKMYKEAQGKFRLALQLLPDKKEIPSLLENISKSGLRSGLEFLLFQPEPEVIKGFYAEIPVTIRVKGGYHNLAVFFDQVGRLPRIVNISNIKISTTKPSGKGGTIGRTYLDASCVATTFRFIEKAPKAQEAKKAKKK